MMVCMSSQDPIESLIALRMPPFWRRENDCFTYRKPGSYRIEDSNRKHYYYLSVDQPKVWILLSLSQAIFVATHFLYISSLGLLFPQYSYFVLCWLESC